MQTRTLWIVHLIALALIVVWAMFDLCFESMVIPLPGVFFSPLESIQTIVNRVGLLRAVCLGIFIATAVGTLAMMGLAFVRSGTHSRARSINLLLRITSVVAIWLSLIVNYPALAWQGKRIRLAFQVSELESIAGPLRCEWPKRDGNIAGIGPFMAYPFGRPTTLVLLQSPQISGASICILSIERQLDGVLRFQLSGNHDDWAEWHPLGSETRSFIGGLNDSHELHASTQLGDGWYLVRYRSNCSDVVATKLVARPTR